MNVSIVYGENVMSAQMLGGFVSILEWEWCSALRKGCVVNGLINKGKR